ncbi:MAG TPA: lipoprotein signal peptidase [Bacteroidales bacterium]|nr:lipoprotein signal peptidase [Bacteroidales bacterium]
MKKGKIAILTILLVLLVDQIVKIWIKTHMVLGEEYRITNWFIIHFTENNGMAFGFELGGSIGKVLLSSFRIVAVGAIGWYLWKLVKDKAPTGLIISIALILAGALGNIIDSLFYGLIFDHSYYQVAHIFPENGGYAGFLHGRVVDMFYFPLIKTHFPAWFPIWGGQEFEFFRPVFNLADSAITTGVAIILLFQRKYFKD